MVMTIAWLWLSCVVVNVGILASFSISARIRPAGSDWWLALLALSGPPMLIWCGAFFVYGIWQGITGR